MFVAVTGSVLVLPTVALTEMLFSEQLTSRKQVAREAARGSERKR
jgi:hypothetical protein